MNTKLSLTATTTFAGGGHMTIEATDVPIDSGYLHELVSVLFEAPDLVASHERKQAADAERAAEVEPPAEPPVAPEVRRHGAKKTPVPKAKPATTRATGTGPGTCSHAILTALADAGGTIATSAAKVGADHGTGTDLSNKKTASTLVADGLLTTTPRTGPTSLTAKGWAAIGRTAPIARQTEAPAKPDLAAVPDPPAILDLGPIERRPFDPDRVRQQQANAL